MADDLLDVNRVAVTIASRHESDASRTDAICHGRDIVVRRYEGVRQSSSRSLAVRPEPSHVASGPFAGGWGDYASARHAASDATQPRDGMETLRFILANLPAIGQRTVEHVSIVGVAVSLAILTGVPIGIAITQNKRAADIVLYIAAMIMTIPSIALFGVMIPVLSLIGQGIGYVPAVIAVLLYSQLPIIRNTYTAISNIDPALREAARGMGMSSLERLRQVEIPLAVPVIMAGVRIAVVINIGITAIATYIGAGGLGAFISRGISQTDSRQLITGAIAVSLLAIVADYLLLWLQHRLTPVGIRTQRPWTRRRGLVRTAPA